MLPILITFSVLNDDKSIVVKEEYIPLLSPPNIYDISVTFFVLKDFKSNDFNAEHRKNIYFISVTFSVLNEDKSNVIKEVHPLPYSPPNIYDILVTFFVLNEDKLSDVKEEQL